MFPLSQEESKVVAAEAALFNASESDKTRFKELTRLLAKELAESPATLAALNDGSADPSELVAKCSLPATPP